jgi:hypothetical protein
MATFQAERHEVELDVDHAAFSSAFEALLERTDVNASNSRCLSRSRPRQLLPGKDGCGATTRPFALAFSAAR